MRILTPTSISNGSSEPSSIDAFLHIHDTDALTGESLLIVSSDDSDYYFKVASNGRVHFRGNSTVGDGQIKVHLQHSSKVGAASSLIWDTSGGVNEMSIRQSEESSDLFIYAHAQSLNLAEFARTTADVTFNAKTTINGQGGDILDLYDDDAVTPINVMKVKDDGVVHLRNTTYGTSMDIHDGAAIVTGGSVVIGIEAINGADFTPTSGTAENSWNTIVGYQAAKNAVSKNGGYITALGAAAGEGSQGNYCVYIGNGAGRLMDHDDTDRNSNIAIGVGAMYLGLNQQGVAIGHEAGRNAYGVSNIHIGFEAGENVGTSVKGSDDNVIIGYQAGKDSDSDDAVLVGAYAGYNAGSSTRSNRNVYVGRRSGYEADGGWNVYLGDETGETTIGDNNTFLGSNVAYNSNVGGTGSMDGNVAIGYNAFGVANIGGWTGITEGTMTNNIVIGHGTCAAVNMASGNVVIGANLLIGDTNNLSNTVVIGSDNAERLRIHSTGQFKFSGYEEFESDGTTENTDFEETPVSILGVDTDGNVVKTDASGLSTATPNLQAVTTVAATTNVQTTFEEGLVVGESTDAVLTLTSSLTKTTFKSTGANMGGQFDEFDFLTIDNFAYGNKQTFLRGKAVLIQNIENETMVSFSRVASSTVTTPTWSNAPRMTFGGTIDFSGNGMSAYVAAGNIRLPLTAIADFTSGTERSGQFFYEKDDNVLKFYNNTEYRTLADTTDIVTNSTLALDGSDVLTLTDSDGTALTVDLSSLSAIPDLGEVMDASNYVETSTTVDIIGGGFNIKTADEDFIFSANQLGVTISDETGGTHLAFSGGDMSFSGLSQDPSTDSVTPAGGTHYLVGFADLTDGNAVTFDVADFLSETVKLRDDGGEGSITYYGDTVARYATGVIQDGSDYMFRVGYNAASDEDLPSMNNLLELDKRGKLTLGKYTSDNSIHDGTPTSFLGVDDDGNVVKTEGSQVIAQYVKASLGSSFITGGGSELNFGASTEADVTQMTQDYSTGSDITYSAGTFTVNRDGLYTIRVNGEFQSLVTQRACPTVYLKVNGSIVDGKSLAYVRQTGAVDEGTVSLTRTMYLVDGDELTVHNRNQGTVNGAEVTTSNEFMTEMYSNNVSVTAPATPTLAEVQTAGNSVLKLQKETADPSSPEEGWMYFNETTKKFRGYNGTAWVDLA